MLSLSPAKLLVVLVIALIVLGPDKLPDLARQAGALWHDLRKLRGRLESEVRGAFPDLPSSHQLTQAVRSPLSLLDDLADKHAASQDQGAPSTDGHGADPATGTVGSPALPATVNGASARTDDTNANGARRGGVGAGGEGASRRAAWDPTETGGIDDPSMN